MLGSFNGGILGSRGIFLCLLLGWRAWLAATQCRRDARVFYATAVGPDVLEEGIDDQVPDLLVQRGFGVEDLGPVADGLPHPVKRAFGIRVAALGLGLKGAVDGVLELAVRGKYVLGLAAARHLLCGLSDHLFDLWVLGFVVRVVEEPEITVILVRLCHPFLAEAVALHDAVDGHPGDATVRCESHGGGNVLVEFVTHLVELAPQLLRHIDVLLLGVADRVGVASEGDVVARLRLLVEEARETRHVEFEAVLSGAEPAPVHYLVDSVGDVVDSCLAVEQRPRPFLLLGARKVFSAGRVPLQDAVKDYAREVNVVTSDAKCRHGRVSDLGADSCKYS